MQRPCITLPRLRLGASTNEDTFCGPSAGCCPRQGTGRPPPPLSPWSTVAGPGASAGAPAAGPGSPVALRPQGPHWPTSLLQGGPRSRGQMPRGGSFQLLVPEHGGCRGHGPEGGERGGPGSQGLLGGRARPRTPPRVASTPTAEACRAARFGPGILPVLRSQPSSRHRPSPRYAQAGAGGRAQKASA